MGRERKLGYKVQMNTFRILLITYLCLALPAWAEVYKCRQPDGKTEISNLPCASGSSTVKAVADDVVPKEVREKAERDAERRQEQVDKLDAARRAQEKEEREAAARQKQGESKSVPASKVDECLRSLARMSLDASRRAELEASCLASGTTSPAPEAPPATPYYYGGGGYVRPPLPHPRPKPTTPPTTDTSKKPGYYDSPDKYKVK